MTTHKSILRLYEFLNKKMDTDLSGILAQNIYECNFGNEKLFKILHKISKENNLEANSNIQALYNFVQLVKTKTFTEADVKKYDPKLAPVYKAFYNIYYSGNKIAFSDRMRSNELFCIYLDSQVMIKTNRMKLTSCTKVWQNAISLLVGSGLLIVNKVYLKVDASSFYGVLYDNNKRVIDNLVKRGIQPFAIACHLYMENRDIIRKPFMYNWSGMNFFKALMTSELWEQKLPKELKDKVPVVDYWTVLSEYSLMTGKVHNVDKRRKVVNEIINEALNSEGVAFIKDYLTAVKLVKSNTLEKLISLEGTKNPARESEDKIKSLLKSKNTVIPTNEDIVKAIKIQFILSKIQDVDFSSKRKDHLVLFKSSKRRLFDLV